MMQTKEGGSSQNVNFNLEMDASSAILEDDQSNNSSVKQIIEDAEKQEPEQIEVQSQPEIEDDQIAE